MTMAMMNDWLKGPKTMGWVAQNPEEWERSCIWKKEKTFKRAKMETL